MDRATRMLEQLTVKPGTRAALDDRDPAWRGGPDFEDLSKAELKAEAEAVLARGVAELTEAQELLWASDIYAVLVIFQAIDAAGKDSAIEHVMSGTRRLSPSGCTPSGSTSRSCRPAPATSGSGRIATRTSTPSNATSIGAERRS
ncbi:MAG TPA: hypothetical protein VFU54_16560 [Actinomycetota bacterium]|nr:hypothetical protein [Actinomycetota bacterium]